MILAVAGGKGGVGKSTISFALADRLDAVLVDGDLAMADLPTTRGPDLHDVLAGRASVTEAVATNGPVAMVSCGRTLAGARAADPRELVDALSRLERRYGPVVVDCPAGHRADAGMGLYAATACVLVTTPARASVADAVRTRALARRLDAGLVRVACNRVTADPPDDRLRELLGAPVVAVPESRAVDRAWRSGQPVTAVAPDGRITEAIDAIADAVQSCKAW